MSRQDSTSRNTGYKALYYLLSLISGFVEIGSLIYLFKANVDLIWILFAGVSYQLGLVSTNPIKLNKKFYLVFALLSLVFLVLLRNNIGFFLIGIFLIASPLQYSRKFLSRKTKITTLNKRIFRVLGFLISFLINTYAILASLIIVMISSIIVDLDLLSTKPRISKISETETNILGMAMVFHQMHYFSYCYILIMVFIEYFKLPFYLSTIVFMIGWISYLTTPKVLRSNKYTTILIIGHAIVVSSLTSIYFLRSLPFVLIFWFITGFGGGTVYCIEKILKTKKLYAKIDLELHENIGHFLGILLTSLVFVITKELFLAFISGSILALLVIILVSMDRWFKKCPVSIMM